MDKKVLKGLIDRFEKPNEFLIRAYHWSSEDGADDIEEKDAYELAEKVIEKYGLTTKKYHLEEDFGIDTEKSTLLAAAGIAGIAIGMAAQRSVSNIISGLFLLADQPFEIGDAVDIGGNAGGCA
ncbi:MAG TPA: mechanosensitive ion channel [Euryarchaeota archaeon]|nr:mechanosensitive ion channel [Euryarchaeota archaeon]